MTVRDLIMTRRSVRNFEDRPIPAEVVQDLLDAAASAPSGGNIQPLAIIAISDPKRRQELSAVVGCQPWVANAPLSLVFCIDYHRVRKWAAMSDVDFRGHNSLAFFLIAYADLMCAAQTVTLLAQEHGLGSVYVGTIQFNISGAREFLKTPECVLPLMVLSLGYPRSIPTGIRKLPASAIVHLEEYTALGDEEIRQCFENKYGAIDDDVDQYLERAYVEAVEADRQADAGWVNRAKDKMSALGIKSSAEFLFKLRYPSEVFVAMNRRIAESMAESGFDFF